MALDLSAASNVLKLDYEGPVRDQLNNSHPLLTVIQRQQRNFFGQEAHVPLHSGRNVGTGARGESGTLPTAGKQQYSLAKFRMAYLYGRITLTGPVIASLQGQGGFVDAIDSEMRGLERDLRDDLLRQLWADGSGNLTDIGATTVDKKTVTVSSTRFLEVGGLYDCMQRDDGNVKFIGKEVSSIASATSVVFTADIGDTLTTSDGIYKTGVRDTTASTGWKSGTNEVWGLEAIVNDDNPAEQDTGFTSSPDATALFGQINRDSNAFWRANMVTGNTLTEEFAELQEGYDESEIEGEATPGLIMTSHRVRRIIAGELTTLRRFGDEVELQGGFTGMKFNNAAIMPDKYAHFTNDPTDTAFGAVYMIAPSSLEWHVLKDWSWVDYGGVLVRTGVGTSGKDEYEATMCAYMNLSANRCNANTAVGNVPGFSTKDIS